MNSLLDNKMKILSMTSFTSQAGCSHDVAPVINEESNKKRGRRKPRTKKPKQQKNNTIIDPTVSDTNSICMYRCSFLLEYITIKPILTNNGSKFIRMRNNRHKRIRLNTFVIRFMPVTFISKYYIEHKSSISSITETFSQMVVTKQKTVTTNECTTTVSKIPDVKENQKKGAAAKKLKTTTEPVVQVEKKKIRKRKSMLEKKPNPLTPYLPKEEVEKGLLNGTLIQGVVRINPKDHRRAYVSNEDRTLQDYLIESVEDRNGALEGDEVVLQLKEDNGTQAIVVYIVNMVHSRLAVGFLKLMPDKNKSFAVIHPRDLRVPRIRVPAICWPPGFYKNPEKYENALFLTKITEWKDVKFAMGMILELIGVSGDLQAETHAILLEYRLDITPYTNDMCKHFRNFGPVTQEEYAYREDIRRECVFTIDPATAKDLDDAVSCKELPNGNFKVGVHIADVAFHLEEGTELDKIVSKKATTIYLVNNTYHMLPVDMCLQCSLLPGQEKRTFSVFWELTKEGEIIDTHFARTVMRSCAKLAYEHAQAIIEDEEVDPEDMPQVHCGYNISDLKRVVKQLQAIAVNLRQKRFESGALRLDQPKLSFSLNALDGEPEGWSIYEIKDSHRMIEEFMLLANMSVAKKIKKDFPDQAFLRHHEPPVQRMLDEAKASLESAGIFIDVSSSGGLQSTLWKYCDDDDYLGKSRMAVLNHLFAKPMKRANYFCATSDLPMEAYWHYALHIPCYTHFTSPIRRYADIMVHRLLAASLGYAKRPLWKKDFVSKIANNCNTKKYDAKKAGDASMELYLAHFVEKNQPFVQDAVVADVREKFFEVIVLATGSVVRMYTGDFDETIKCEAIPLENKTDVNKATKAAKDTEEPERKYWRLEVTFPQNKQFPCASRLIIERFTILKVALMRKEKSNKLDARLERPLPSLSFERVSIAFDSTTIESSSDSD